MNYIGLKLLIKYFFRIFNPFVNNQMKFSVIRSLKIMIFILFFGILQIVNRLFLLLDNLFFPSFKKINIIKPLFIVGVPRSGTTFLHSILSQDKTNFTTCTLGEMIFAPAITQKIILKYFFFIDRAIGYPIKKLFQSIESGVLSMLHETHKTGLESPEEDFILLMPYMACFLLIFPFPYKEIWDLAFFDQEFNMVKRREIMIIYKKLIQRHMYVYGYNRRYLSKNASFSGWINDLKKTFPDLNLVCCIRKPEKAVPSILSVMRKGWLSFNNDLGIEYTRKKIIDMMDYYYNCISKYHFSKEKTHWIVFSMPDIQDELENTIKLIYNKFSLRTSRDYEKSVNDSAVYSRKYKSKHRYNKNEFDLKTQNIMNRLKNIYLFLDSEK